jgi:cell division protein FtsZ
MSINFQAPELRELKPRIMVAGVGGAGCNAVNNMIESGLTGVEFIVANTDAQALTASKAGRIIQMGLQVTEGLGAGAQPEVGRAAAEEAIEEIRDHLAGAHMCFVTAGMGGGTGTGAAPVIARTAREMGILTVGVVTKPFHFEGMRRMRVAEAGISELTKAVDTLIVIPNQNLFRVANEKTTFADAFAMADQVLYSGVASITDLMVKQGLVNLDFADVRSIMREMGKAMMGTGEASGEKRAILAAEAAIANPLLDEVSMKGARGLLISITGGSDMTLYEVDEAASRIRQEVDEDANIILGATFDESLNGIIRVSVVATGIDQPLHAREISTTGVRVAETTGRLRAGTQPRAVEPPAFQAVMEAAPAPIAAAPIAPAPAPEPVYHQPAYQAAAHDVQLQPVQRQPMFQEPAPEPMVVAEPEPLPAHFIPPQAEMPVRQQRMPSIEDLPQPGRVQWEAHHNPEMQQANSPEAKRRTLFERLAAFGQSRQEERVAAPQQRPLQSQRPAAPGPVHAEYGPRRAIGGPRIEPQRIQSQARTSEEEQLEIPAFLRRQAN